MNKIVHSNLSNAFEASLKTVVRHGFSDSIVANEKSKSEQFCSLEVGPGHQAHVSGEMISPAISKNEI
jgi:hypothetical protein